MGKRLYISNIPNRATEASVSGLFAASGAVLNLITDARTGKPKYMSFLVMAAAEEAPGNRNLERDRAARQAVASERSQHPGAAGTT
jgi:hypothetical protein